MFWQMMTFVYINRRFNSWKLCSCLETFKRHANINFINYFFNEIVFFFYLYSVIFLFFLSVDWKCTRLFTNKAVYINSLFFFKHLDFKFSFSYPNSITTPFSFILVLNFFLVNKIEKVVQFNRKTLDSRFCLVHFSFNYHLAFLLNLLVVLETFSYIIQ